MTLTDSDAHGLASSQEAKKPKPWLDQAKPSQILGLSTALALA
jgi:hypothetical protein